VAQRAAVHAVAQTGGDAKTKHLSDQGHQANCDASLSRCCE
jgi:hypothetical protein